MKSLYDEPAYYGMMFDARGDDVAFYRALVDRAAASRDRNAHVIEYGAGTGRVALPLAAAGHDVDAIESAPAMAAVLRERLSLQSDDVRSRMRIVEGDALQLALDSRADVAICPFNGLAHFETQAQLASFFERVHRHLERGGLFAFDVWLPSPGVLAGAQSRSPWLYDPEGGRRVRCIEQFRYDAMSQVLTTVLEIRDERGELVDRLETRLRQFFPQETLSLLSQHGFDVLHRTTHFEPFEPRVVALDDRASGEPGEMLAYVCTPSRD